MALLIIICVYCTSRPIVSLGIKRGADYLFQGETCKGSTRYANYPKDDCCSAGGLSAVNAIGTYLRDLMDWTRK